MCSFPFPKKVIPFALIRPLNVALYYYNVCLAGSLTINWWPVLGKHCSLNCLSDVLVYTPYQNVKIKI